MKIEIRLFVLSVLVIGCAARSPIVAPGRLELFPLKEAPTLGSFNGQEIRLGGFSGLCYLGEVEGKKRFLTVTDRGPNPDPVPLPDKSKGRAFLLPQLQPSWVTVETDPSRGTLTRISKRGLTDSRGVALTGLPPGTTPRAKGFTTETPVDSELRRLPFDPRGLDLEGIACSPAGNVWAVEEYGPSLVEFSPEGRVLTRYIPEGSRVAGLEGVEALPRRLSRRRINRGFEGIALSEGRAFLFLQSPFDEKSRWLPIYEFDVMKRQVVGEYLYRLEDGVSDKVGDAVALGKGKFLVVEQDSTTGKNSFHRLFELDIRLATNVLGQDWDGIQGPTGSAFVPVKKRQILDLVAVGYDFAEKIEGITVVDRATLAVLNDDDFGIVADKSVARLGARVNPGSRSVLGLIHLREPLDH